MSLKDLGDKIRSNTVGVSLAAVLTAASSLGNFATAQDSQASAQAPSANVTSVQQPQLNTNPLNIKDSHWEVMKKVAETVRNSPNSQVIYREVKKGNEIDRQVNTNIVHFGVPDEYWRLANRVRPPQLGNRLIVPNITTLDDYIQRLAIQKGETGIYLGVIGDSKRVIEVAKRVNDTIYAHHYLRKGSAPFISGIFEVHPTDRELPSLSQGQKEKGLILYVRGTRFNDFNNTLVGENGFDFDKMIKELTVGTGIYVDDNKMLLDMQHLVWEKGLAYMNNAEYAEFIKERTQSLDQGNTKNVQNTDTTSEASTKDGDGSGDSSTQATVADPLAHNL